MRVSLEKEEEKEEEIEPLTEIARFPRKKPRYRRKVRRKVRFGKEDLLLVIVIPSILFLIFYGVFTAELAIKDALTFLTGLIGGTWVGASAGLSGKRG